MIFTYTNKREFLFIDILVSTTQVDLNKLIL